MGELMAQRQQSATDLEREKAADRQRLPVRVELEALKASFRADSEASEKGNHDHSEGQGEAIVSSSINTEIERFELQDPSKSAGQVGPAETSEHSETATYEFADSSLQPEALSFNLLATEDPRRVMINALFQNAARAWQERSDKMTAERLLADLCRYADEAGVLLPTGVLVLQSRIQSGDKLDIAGGSSEKDSPPIQSAQNLTHLARSLAPSLSDDQIQQAISDLAANLNVQTKSTEVGKWITDERKGRAEKFEKMVELLDELRKGLADPAVKQVRAYLSRVFESRRHEFGKLRPMLSVLSVPLASDSLYDTATIFLDSNGWVIERSNGTYRERVLFDIHRPNLLNLGRGGGSIRATMGPIESLMRAARLFSRGESAHEVVLAAALGYSTTVGRENAFVFTQMAQNDSFSWKTIKSSVVRYLDAQFRAGLQNPIFYKGSLIK